MGKYRKQFGSLIVGEITRVQKSIEECAVTAEGYEQSKREHHLKSKRSWLQSDAIIFNMECFFLTAMPDCGYSVTLKAMEEVLKKEKENWSFVQFQPIKYEQLRTYFQYLTNPVEEKMVALSNIAGTDTFGRGNGHMSIVPVITVVKEMHLAAGVAEQSPLSSPELQLWVRDSAAKYEVLKRAPKFDFAESLPLMHEANFGDSNDKCLLEKIRNWTCLLVSVSTAIYANFSSSININVLFFVVVNLSVLLWPDLLSYASTAQQQTLLSSPAKRWTGRTITFQNGLNWPYPSGRVRRESHNGTSIYIEITVTLDFAPSTTC